MERKGRGRTQPDASRTDDGRVALSDEQLETISGGAGKVVQAGGTQATGSVLQGDQCLVFFLGGLPRG
jgi:hypothetical protein